MNRSNALLGLACLAALAPGCTSTDARAPAASEPTTRTLVIDANDETSERERFPSGTVKQVLASLAENHAKRVVFLGPVDGSCTLPRGDGWLETFGDVVRSRNLHAGWLRDIIIVSADPIPFATLPLEREAPARAGRLPAGLVDLDAKDESIEDVLRQIARQVHFPIVVKGGAPDRVSLSVTRAPWRDVVAWLARVGRLEVREERRALVLDAGPRNSIQAAGAPASVFFPLLATQAGKSVIMPGGVRGELDLDLKNVRFERALAASAAMIGYDVVEDDGALVIERRGP
jgi:hypothetical protein